MQDSTAGTGKKAINLPKPNPPEDAGLEAAICKHHRKPAPIPTETTNPQQETPNK
jgi:hypothetical protein